MNNFQQSPRSNNASDPRLPQSYVDPLPMGSGYGGGVSTLINFGLALAKEPPWGCCIFTMGNTTAATVGDAMKFDLGNANVFSASPSGLIEKVFGAALKKTPVPAFLSTFVYPGLDVIFGTPGTTAISYTNEESWAWGSKYEVHNGCEDIWTWSQKSKEARLAMTGSQACELLKNCGHILLSKLKPLEIFIYALQAVIGLLKLVLLILPHFATKNAAYCNTNIITSVDDNDAQCYIWKITSMIKVLLFSLSGFLVNVSKAYRTIVTAANEIGTIKQTALSPDKVGALETTVAQLGKFKVNLVGKVIVIAGVGSAAVLITSLVESLVGNTSAADNAIIVALSAMLLGLCAATGVLAKTVNDVNNLSKQFLDASVTTNKLAAPEENVRHGEVVIEVEDGSE